MSLTESESGVSYGIGVLLIFLVVFTGFYIGTTPVLNGINEHANKQIDAGQMSEQRKNAHDFINLIWVAAPVFFVLAGLAWAIVRAIEARGDLI